MLTNKLYFPLLLLSHPQTQSNHLKPSKPKDRNERTPLSITSHPSSSNPNHPFSASPFQYVLDIFHFQKIASRPLLPSSSPSPKKESSRHPCHRPPKTRPWPACKKKEEKKKSTTSAQISAHRPHRSVSPSTSGLARCKRQDTRKSIAGWSNGESGRPEERLACSRRSLRKATL